MLGDGGRRWAQGGAGELCEGEQASEIGQENFAQEWRMKVTH